MPCARTADRFKQEVPEVRTREERRRRERQRKGKMEEIRRKRR